MKKSKTKNFIAEETRKETVKISVEVLADKENLVYLQGLKDTFKLASCVEVDDIFSLDYTFDVSYLNGINRRFELLLDLLNQKNADVKKVSYVELAHGKILLQEILNKIEAVSLAIGKKP